MKLSNFVKVFFVVLLIAAFAVTPVLAQGENPGDPTAFDMGAISQAVQTLLYSILVPLVALVGRWLFTRGSYEKSKLTDAQVAGLEIFINTCIYAAEQLKLNGLVKDKFDWVEGEVTAWVLSIGLSLDIANIRARIEAAVAKEFNYEKLFPQD